MCGIVYICQCVKQVGFEKQQRKTKNRRRFASQKCRSQPLLERDSTLAQDVCTLAHRKEKTTAGSDDTSNMMKGGGYIGARTRQPPTAQTIEKKLLWVRRVVFRSTQTQTLTVVAFVILQCIPCFYECRCMFDGVLIQFV